MDMIPTPRHEITRVRRETRRRTVSVTAVERLTPNMQRIRFASPDLHDFESSGPDDHVKLFLPTSASGARTARRSARPQPGPTCG